MACINRKLKKTPLHIFPNRGRSKTFPDPRNPVIIVAGMRLSGGILVRTSAVSLWVAAADTVNGRTPCPLFDDFTNLLVLFEIWNGLAAADTETVRRNVWEERFDRHGSGRSVWALSGLACLFASTKKAVAKSTEIADMASDRGVEKKRLRSDREWEEMAEKICCDVFFCLFIYRVWRRF